MAYETTKVPVVQSQSEIRRMLMKYGGTGVAFISQPPMEGFEGMIPIDGVDLQNTNRGRGAKRRARRRIRNAPHLALALTLKNSANPKK